MMRIITGRARGTKLVTLEGNNTRPTSERVKEAVFSMIQFDIEGRNVLDLFAGSGQMGLEALSRGAAKATFIDNSKDALKVKKSWLAMMLFILLKKKLAIKMSLLLLDQKDLLYPQKKIKKLYTQKQR